MYAVVVKEDHVCYLIRWWVSCTFIFWCVFLVLTQLLRTCKCLMHITLHSGLSKSNFRNHYGDATEQCLGMIDEINVFSVSDEMLWVMGQTGRRQVDCSRVIGQQQQKSDHRHWHVCKVRQNDHGSKWQFWCSETNYKRKLLKCVNRPDQIFKAKSVLKCKILRLILGSENCQLFSTLFEHASPQSSCHSASVVRW